VRQREVIGRRMETPKASTPAKPQFPFVDELVRLLKLPAQAHPQQVFSKYKEKELMLEFHPDKASKKTDELASAQRKLGRSGDPTALANEVFHRIREAGRKVKAMGGNANAGPTAHTPPPPLIGVEVDVVSTVGDFGIDLVVLFRFNPADVSRIPEVRFDMTLHNPGCDALGSACHCRKHRLSSNSLDHGFGEFVIQNQMLVNGLGSPGARRTLELSVGTANGSLKSTPLVVCIDISNKRPRKLKGEPPPRKRPRPS
jgi:hypothetical protein